MEQQKIDTFIAQNATKFPQQKLGMIREALAKVDDDKASMVLQMDMADPTTILLLSVLCGTLGIDRFMLGEVGLGILKLFTCGGCYVWWIIDMVKAQSNAREYNYKKLSNLLLSLGISGLY